MSKDVLFERVRSLVAQAANLEATGIKPETSFQQIGLDSLDAVSLISDMEEEFEVEIPNEEIFKISSVQDVLDAIERNR